MSAVFAEQMVTFAFISMYPRTTTDVSREQMLLNVDLQEHNWHSIHNVERECLPVYLVFRFNESSECIHPTEEACVSTFECSDELNTLLRTDPKQKKKPSLLFNLDRRRARMADREETDPFRWRFP